MIYEIYENGQESKDFAKYVIVLSQKKQNNNRTISLILLASKILNCTVLKKIGHVIKDLIIYD